ncbi:BZIP domain-containing protein [Mycena indigotica]|uniref:BZIP domain-containing protein n=1 Tax=Mycena indigotica TaxID=2126181 RepID=A0A8H6S334_9AGAR|nr:BZIP domain-containing protein [Mycena indigotica]KAF7292009.1 BZIP domain-containing protein [Mycena indigotica]
MAQSIFAPPSMNEYTQEFNDFLNLDLFSMPNPGGVSSPASGSSGSRESTPHLQTPPQVPPANSFPEINDPSTSPNTLYSFLDEEVKALDPLSFVGAHPYDLFSPITGSSSGGGGGSSITTEAELSSFLGGIDPQLVGSPAGSAMLPDFESGLTSPEEPPLIAPVKVGGHGKARKGTVIGGGVTKKQPTVSSAHKENSSTVTSIFPTAASTFRPKPAASNKGDDDDEDDDDVPADWRPPPEVFAKMTSKEKRQLRNKISARNFRIRRKEYITTLEDNIAERDRLLEAIRTELGSTQSENVALRQEIATLKRTLLENRGPAPVLPPPAPLSTTSSPVPSTSSGSPLPTFRTDKDIDISNRRFWGGVSLGGNNITSVHTARIPELLGANPFADSPFARATGQEPAQVHQQENLNPMLNTPTAGPGKVAEVLRSGIGLGTGTGAPNMGLTGDAFGDANPFTVRSLDAYRMHLWNRMAAQYKYNKELNGLTHNSNNSPFSSGNNSPINNPSPFANASTPGSWKAHTPPQSPPFGQASLSGLAGRMGAKYFTGSSSSPSNANSLSAAFGSMSLSGKQSPLLTQRQREKERESTSQKDTEAAMYAAMASQTLVRRLGSAFWDAFSGTERSGPSASPFKNASSSLDTEKVRKVLEGKAVVRVVDIEPATPKPGPATVSAATQAHKCSTTALTEALEEGIRSLSLGKKSS